MADDRATLFAELYADRVLAHGFLFSHRHWDAEPDYKAALIGDFHSTEKHRLEMVFRGGGKSTTAEEAIALGAEFQDFRYCLIIGNTIDRACQRLHSIRHEFETNERLNLVFGDPIGPIWSADQLLLSNGVMIQALGRGQSLRGAKHLDQRPDMLFGDDLEEYPDVATDKARQETFRWFTQDVLPALDPHYRARIAATPLHPEALPPRLQASGWETRLVPICHPGPDGKMVSSWPARFPMTEEDAKALGGRRAVGSEVMDRGWVRPNSIDAMQDAAQRAGMMRQFRAEYLCEPTSEESQTFTKVMIEAARANRAPSWEAKYVMIDPARTVRSTSALTGAAAWSWIGGTLWVWDAWQKALMPDQIIDACFRMNEELQPVFLGVEEDGLNEWILQAIRQEQVRRGVTLPIVPMRAPKGKFDFIRSLQIWFHARELKFAKELPELETALLAFPSGKIDAPNALAYAIPMRGGASIYGEFDGRHVAPDLEPARNRRVHLALNATRTLTAAMLVQYLEGAVRVFADWIVEGEPSEAVPHILRSARLEAGQAVKCVAPPSEFERYSAMGVVQIAAKSFQEVDKGGAPEKGRPMVRDLLQRQVRGAPALMVCDRAHWTLNGFAGGYRYLPNKQGLLMQTAEEGRYKVLMEALEAFMALTEARLPQEQSEDTNMAFTPGGVPYASALPQRRR